MAKTVTRRINVFINDQEAGGSIRNIKSEYRKLLREVERGVDSVEEYDAKTRELQRLDGIIRDHRKNIREVNGSWQKSQAGLGKLLGLAAGAFATGQIAAAGRELFDLGVKMESVTQKAQIVFGDSLPQVNKQASENAAIIGTTRGEYTQLATAIADVLKPMGFQTEEAARLSTNTVNLSGALSAWTDGQFSAAQVSEILKKALVGEREQLKQLGIVIQENDIKQRLAQKGLEDLTGQTLKQAKAAATLELITEQSADAQASFAENTDTMIRRQAELRAQLASVREDLAVALIPVWERLIGVAAGVVDVIEEVAQAIDQVVDPAGAAADAFFTTQAAVDDLQTGLVPLLDRYDQLKEKGVETEAEQAELDRIIGQIAKTVPGAVTAFDQYGRALDINTESARKYLETQEAILEFQNADAIEQNEKRLVKLQEEQKVLQEFLEGTRTSYNNLFRDQDKFFERGTQTVSGFTKATELSQVEIGKLQTNLETTSRDIIAIQGILRQLRGQSIVPEGEDGGGGVDPDDDPVIVYETEKLARLEELAAAGDDLARQEIARRIRITEELEKQTERQAKVEAAELKRTISQLEKLQTAVEKAGDDLLEGQLADDQAAVFAIRRRYQAQIEEAIRLEKSQNEQIAAEATRQRIELERIQAEAVAKFYEEQDEKNLTERVEAEQEIRLAILDEQDAQLQLVQDQYDRLIEMAEQYGLDVVEIEQARRAELEKLRQQFADQAEREELQRQRREDRARKKEEKIQRARIAAEESLQQAKVGAFKAGLDQIAKIAGDNTALSAALFAFDKALATAEILVNLQREISAISLKYAAIPGGALLAGAEIAAAKIRAATGIGTIVATTIGEIVQKKRGGWHGTDKEIPTGGSSPATQSDPARLPGPGRAGQLSPALAREIAGHYQGRFLSARGADDGITYRAEYLGKVTTGLLPGHPVVLASEQGPEYFVSAQALRDPQVLDYVRMIDNIVADGSRGGGMAGGSVRQFARGGATQQLPDSDGQATGGIDIEGLTAAVENLNARLEQLAAILGAPIYAVLDDETIISTRQRLNELQEASGGILNI